MKQLTTIIAALALLATGDSLAQMGGSNIPTVRLAEVVETELTPTTWVAGTVISRSDARLAAEQQGRLLSVLDVGTRVRKGDVVAEIDPTSLRLRVEELQAEAERIRARLAYLEAEYRRQQRLAEMQLTSETELDLTRSDQRVSESELKVAESRLEQAREDLARTRIRAPFDGVVVERLIQTGERVSIGDVVLRLKNPEDLEIVARPPLEFMPYVQIGDELTVDAGQRGTSRWPIRTRVSLGNEDIHVFEMRLNADPGAFATGETVRVAVPIAHSERVTAVPRDALVLRSDGISVFIIDDQMRARNVKVEPGVGNHRLVGVTGDLQPGYRVVVRGNERLQPGQKVQIAEADLTGPDSTGIANR